MADPMAATSFPRFNLPSSSTGQFSDSKPQSSSSLERGNLKNPQITFKVKDEPMTARKFEKSERKEASPSSSVSSSSSVASPSTSSQKSSSKPISTKTSLPISKATVPASNSNNASKSFATKGKKKKKKVLKVSCYAV